MSDADEATDTSQLRNPMRYSITSREIDVEGLGVSVTKVEVRPGEGNIYIHWEVGPEAAPDVVGA